MTKESRSTKARSLSESAAPVSTYPFVLIVIELVGWYSVSPEAIAAHTAARFLQALGPRTVVIDAMAGIGGNTIQFAHYFDKVIAIDISKERLDMAAHNAAVYGVDENIEFISGDFCQLAGKLKVPRSFVSHLWLIIMLIY